MASEALDLVQSSDKFSFMIKQCFVVFTLGYWGRGKTLKEAAENCRQSGAGNSQPTVIKLVYGDDKAELNSNGYLLTENASTVDGSPVDTVIIDIGNGLKLSNLLKMNK